MAQDCSPSRRQWMEGQGETHPRPLASRNVATILRNELGFVSSRRFCISSSSMNVAFASSYTQLSTAPAVADQPMVLVRRF
jgi:hypothetical protein